MNPTIGEKQKVEFPIQFSGYKMKTEVIDLRAYKSEQMHIACLFQKRSHTHTHIQKGMEKGKLN